MLISSALGLLWPGVFGHGDTLAAVALGSAGLWIFHILIARGVQGAAVINKIVTVAKIVPILTFVLVTIFALKAHVFSANFWGGEPKTAGALFGQVRATMLVTVFVFLGIEGASVLLAICQTAAGCWQGDPARLCGCAGAVRRGDDLLLRHLVPRRAGRSAAAVYGRSDGGGGTTFAFGVAASASAPGTQEKALLTIAVAACAAVTGITLYLAGHVQRRISLRGAMLLDRLAGILLTAIAVILLANGFTDLVLARLRR